MSFSVADVRKDFPIFERTIRDGKRLVYLDSGATSQKPWAVINAESDFYSKHNAAVHRGAHQLAEEATDAYEGARAIVAEFLGAQDNEIIFTKSATESINAVAYAMGNAEPGNRFALTASDSTVVTEMEHHAHLIPWQQLAKRTGAQLKWFKVNQDSRLDLSNIDQVITANTKVVALIVLDACQSVPHMRVNVVELDVDFLAFSGHKSVGPTGVGILWGKSELLSELPPFLTGGSMVTAVTMESATWADAPQKFEAGVPNMAQAVGLGAALNYLSNIGMDAIAQHERSLTGYALDKLLQIPGLRIVGPQDNVDRGAALSFTIKDIHPHDVGQYVDSQGIAVRTGHHCAWPLTKIMNVPATTRASFYLYNDEQDVDALVEALLGAQKYFGKF